MHTHRLTVSGDVVRKRFVSWADGEAEREWTGLVTLAGAVPGLAPTPIGREVEDGAPVVVMSRLPGASLGNRALSPAQVDGLGASLRRLFAAPVGVEVAERALGPAGLRGLTEKWAVEEHDLAGCRDRRLVGDALEQARDWLARHDGRYDGLVDRVLSRGDGNLANLVWDGRVCRFVDFEDFGCSELTYELADLVEHASSRLRDLLDTDRLLAGFDLAAEQRERLAAHRRLLAVFWLVMLLPDSRGFARNPAGSTDLQARHVLELLT